MAIRRIFEDALGCVFLVEEGKVWDLSGTPDGAGLSALVKTMDPGDAMTPAAMQEYEMALDDEGALVSLDEEAVNGGFRIVAQGEADAAGPGVPAVLFWPENMTVSAYLFGLEGTGPSWAQWKPEPVDPERDAYDRAQERSGAAWMNALGNAARHNLGVLIEEMALQGVRSIEIEVAGEADDGAVQAVRLLPGGNLAAECSGLRGIRHDEEREDWIVREKEPMPLGALVRHVAWDLLQAQNPDWWDGPGGSGTLSITAVGMQVQLRRGVEITQEREYIERPAAYRLDAEGPSPP